MTAHRPALRSLTTAAVLALALTLAGCGDDEPSTTDSTSEASSSPTSAGPSTSAKPKPPAGPTLDITVSGDDVSPMAQQIDLSTGQALTVRISSDRPGELHVHASPEQYVEFGAGKTRQKLTIDQPGQVDVEEHESGALVARLLVK